jgi:release factor glutamine methyltransferase
VSGERPIATLSGLTVDAARRSLGKLLRDASIDSPELDARLLIGAVLNLDLTGLATLASRVVDDQEAAQLSVFAKRRMAGEPVARIIGVKEFWGLPLKLSSTTLVPRPDTETVVEAALNFIKNESTQHQPRIADIGTGSGAILLALLSEMPGAWGVGTDIDESALRTAADNARHLQLAQRTAFVRCDYAEALGGPFDIIVSNPPYIPSHEIEALEIEVRDHDPRRALDGGTDGLNAYRAIVAQTADLLNAGGVLLVEVGQGQSGDVERLMWTEGLTVYPSRTDLAGIPRVAIGQKCGSQGPVEQ